MKMKKVFATMLTSVLVLGLATTSQLNVYAYSQKEVDQAIAEQGFWFADSEDGNRLNTDQNDEKWGNERQMVYLTDPVTEERITEVRINGEYILHYFVVNDGVEKEPLEDVSIMLGQGDDYYTVTINAITGYSDCNEYVSGSVYFSTSYPVAERFTDTAGDGWARFVAVGKAKLYNHGGQLNGAWVNHKTLGLTWSAAPDFRGMKIGYDDQDGRLPYGKDYACEVRVRVKLKTDNLYFWSDPTYEGEYTGRTIDENGQLVSVNNL